MAMRLRTKLTLAFAAAAAPALVATAAALSAVGDALESEYVARLDAASLAVEVEIRRAQTEVRRASAELAASAEVMELVRAWRRSDLGALVPAAGALLRASGLDALEVIDAKGRVLSSGQLPGRFGEIDLALLDLAQARPGEALVAWMDLPANGGIGRRATLVAASRIGADPESPAVVAGRALDQTWVTQIADATGAQVELLDAQSKVLVRSGDSAHRAARPSYGLTDVAPLRRVVQLAAPGGAPAAALSLSVSTTGLVRAKSRILLAAGAALAVALLVGAALAAWLARRVTAPLEALEEGARAIARGDLAVRVEARATGEVSAVVEAFNAMSADLSRATARAVAAERVAAWREMAKWLAHEIKNPLTPISMSIETLQSAYAGGHPKLDEIFRESTRAILEEVASLRRIVAEFSEFARLPAPAPVPCDASDLAQGALALHGVAPGVTVVRDLAPGLSVEADRELILRALTNLIKNAVEAMDGAGTLTVRTLPLDAREAAIEVQDTGPGVAAEDRQRIFSASFTTKAEGSGLGLAIARRIAEEHGGRLELRSPPGEGAVFRLVLPRAATAGSS